MDKTPAKPPVADRTERTRPLWQAVAACCLGGAVAFVLHPEIGPVLSRDAGMSIRLVQLADRTEAGLTGAGFGAPRSAIEDVTRRLSGQGYVAPAP